MQFDIQIMSPGSQRINDLCKGKHNIDLIFKVLREMVSTVTAGQATQEQNGAPPHNAFPLNLTQFARSSDSMCQPALFGFSCSFILLAVHLVWFSFFFFAHYEPLLVFKKLDYLI